ncbi:hypothetical protein QBC40DRAFT_296973 [Triangularia verruculosa]|uniref:Uncharacterized protein n=1 Tax=Triangularia verruculosa TaxID=2587418 RepID=A0AAN6XKB6_9PEZI|nr:hypothetical protein QBC40DRAFT_296973 [Triangularia verruculosa]
MNGERETGAGGANGTGRLGASAGTQEARRAAVARLTTATARREAVGELSAATAALSLGAHVHTNGQPQAASASPGSAPELPRILITSPDGTSVWATDAPGGDGPNGSNGTQA